MWKNPWGYKEGFIICGGLFTVGALWQLIIGSCSLTFLSYPVNVVSLLVYVAVLVIVYVFFRKRTLIRWMSSYFAAVTGMIALTVLVVLMGLIRQLPSSHLLQADTSNGLGFSYMLSSCPFVLLFFWFITLLGMTILRRLMHVRWWDIPFLCNHLGLFIALIGAILGSADMQRLKMTTQIGKAEWRAMNEYKEVVELPLAVELRDFMIEEYPPKLMLIDNETGRIVPQGRPVSLFLEEEFDRGALLDWQVELIERLPEAASVATEDTVKFVAFHSTGATYAVYVKALNVRTNERREGWVSCGSFLFPYKALRLNQHLSLIMPDREPRKFTSDVIVYTESGFRKEAVIEVNHPLEIQGWKIYLLSYDEEKGRWSDTSIFELVKDPWLPVVYTGIWMMIVGAICMFSLTRKRKEELG
ncbi:MAG: hypothetical protein GY706_13140 [Bacteroides sp.]|nr:hypothetical protein [Bacteroides sp.]